MTGREGGYVVPADPANAVGGLKKKGAGSRSWILIDSSGQEIILDVDKYAIMHRVQIHARDLRILDPLLSYPSAILGRERAIVLNLEHIKAIITSEEVLLRDPLDDNVVPIVEDLRRRLKPVNANREDNGDGKELAVHHDVETGEEDDSPFEFRALEVALEAICSYLSARTIELETAVYPALDMLTSKISSRNLDRVRKLKSQMTRLTARVQKKVGWGITSGSGAASWFLASPTIGSKISRASRASVATVRGDENDVEELEMLLEAYFMQIDGTFNKLTTLREYIDNTEDYINIQLDNHRNRAHSVRALSQFWNRMSIYLLFGSRNLWYEHPIYLE
ncbi:UNVERIFIED_CONTAM: Magnesium transporter MRS2-2 [Sesamum latifolium]|uniref:Magnesium transporter n=1 Tax=Sesamum latifolium TaxID=2727402 RepID=A0AAW2VW38_9LAMI